MNNQRLLEELVALLEANSITIRTEPLGGNGGGLCDFKGKCIFFQDTQAPTAETAALCAKAVAEKINIENIYIRPEVRRFIEKNKSD